MDDDATADGPQIAGDITAKKTWIVAYLYCKMKALLHHLDVLFPGKDPDIKLRHKLPGRPVFKSVLKNFVPDDQRRESF